MRVSVCLSVTDMTHHDTIFFPRFELRTGYVNCLEYSGVCKSHSALQIFSLRPTRTQNGNRSIYHTCAPARASVNPTQYLGRIA